MLIKVGTCFVCAFGTEVSVSFRGLEYGFDCLTLRDVYLLASFVMIVSCF